jgi:hypothetical protein
MRRLLIMTAVVLLFGGESESALADPIVVEGTYGSWTAFAARNPMTDKAWYGAIVKSAAGDTIQLECEPPAIQVAPRLHISVRTKGYLGDGYRSAEYRVDSKPS